MAQITRWQKNYRLFKRKLLKPLLYSIMASVMLYLVISNIIIQKKLAEIRAPQFTITRLSSDFDETEFMHMLLTIQEIKNLPEEGAELREFVNGPFPGGCPRLLEFRLKQMNWNSQAFLIRIKKFFALNKIYERITRIDNTLAFLMQEAAEARLPKSTWSQIKVLQQERAKIIEEEMSEEEYNFMKKYNGIATQLQLKK